MATTGNKLIDKYQYNQNSTHKDGIVEIITAKHTVLKIINTLKKINTKNLNQKARYKCILNEIQILKHLPVSDNYIKCHKMLRTSNNIYIVYDYIGQNQTLKQFIERSPNFSEQQRFEVINKLIKCLKQFRKFNIIHAYFNVNNIQINQKHQIKFVNFQQAFNLQKIRDITNQSFLNILQSDFTPPQIKNAETLINLQNSDIFCLGNIILEMIKKNRVNKSRGKTNLSLEQDFYRRRQADLLDFTLKCVNKNQKNRCSLKEVQQYFQKKLISLKLVSSRAINQEKKLLSLSKSKSNINLALSQPYQSKAQRKNSGSDTKSIKSQTQNFFNSIPNMSEKNQNNYFAQRDNFKQNHVFRQLMYQLIHKRNLSLFLLQISKIFLSIQAVDEQTRIIAGFLHLKKSGIVICQLAKNIQKSQFKTVASDKQKKQFTRSSDYLKLSHFIKNQMNLNKKIIQQTATLLEQKISSLFRNNKSFKTQCQSQNINNLYLKQIILKFVDTFIDKLNYCHSSNVKISKIRSPEKTRLIKSPSHLKISSKYSQQQIQLQSPKLKVKSKFSNVLDVQSNLLQIYSTRSIGNSIVKTSRSTQPQQYQESIIKKIISKTQLQYISLACNIFKYDTYQQVFNKFIQPQKIYNRNQFAINEYKMRHIEQLTYNLRKAIRQNQ